jgi:hypothetical protein
VSRSTGAAIVSVVGSDEAVGEHPDSPGSSGEKQVELSLFAPDRLDIRDQDPA